MPDTDCPVCWEAEASKMDRFRRFLDERHRLRAAGLAATLGQIMAATYATAGSGGAKPLTWYQRHRAAFERTGDVIELTRMLRHPSEFPPMTAPRREPERVPVLLWLRLGWFPMAIFVVVFVTFALILGAF